MRILGMVWLDYSGFCPVFLHFSWFSSISAFFLRLASMVVQNDCFWLLGLHISLFLGGRKRVFFTSITEILNLTLEYPCVLKDHCVKIWIPWTINCSFLCLDQWLLNLGVHQNPEDLLTTPIARPYLPEFLIQ